MENINHQHLAEKMFKDLTLDSWVPSDHVFADTIANKALDRMNKDGLLDYDVEVYHDENGHAIRGDNYYWLNEKGIEEIKSAQDIIDNYMYDDFNDGATEAERKYFSGSEGVGEFENGGKLNSYDRGVVREEMSEFVKIAKRVNSGKEFIQETRKITNTNPMTSDWFFDKYGEDDMYKAADKFVADVKRGEFDVNEIYENGGEISPTHPFDDYYAKHGAFGGSYFSESNTPKMEHGGSINSNENSGKIIYTVPVGWYNSNYYTIYQTLTAWKIEGLITSFKMLGNNEDEKNDNFEINFTSNKPIDELREIINGKTTRVETVKIEETFERGGLIPNDGKHFELETIQIGDDEYILYHHSAGDYDEMILAKNGREEMKWFGYDDMSKQQVDDYIQSKKIIADEDDAEKIYNIALNNKIYALDNTLYTFSLKINDVAEKNFGSRDLLRAYNQLKEAGYSKLFKKEEDEKKKSDDNNYNMIFFT